MAKLIVFDLDGTIVDAPDFYRKVYSGSLTQLVGERRGKAGLKVLEDCRKNFDGKGELALFALNIPFREWAAKLLDAPFNLIPAQSAVVEPIRALDGYKVVYTGSPTLVAQQMLQWVGFAKSDFDLIIGWEEPDLYPVKWSGSSAVFRLLLQRFGCSPNEAWSVGDDWTADLQPAGHIGMRTALIGKEKRGSADVYFPSIKQFLDRPDIWISRPPTF